MNGRDDNVDKKFALILESTYNLNFQKEMDIFPSIINNAAIPFVTSCKNLVIDISQDLTWNDKISKITFKINDALHAFYVKTRSFPVDVKVLLANHLIQSHFDHACIALSDYFNDKLLKSQHHCIRYIYNLRKHQSVASSRKKLRSLTSKNRRTFCIDILT